MKLNFIYIVFISLALSSAILLTLLFVPLFQWSLATIDTTLLDLSTEQILQDYRILLNYLINPFNNTLQFNYFSMSSQGAFHFYEVKQWFLLNNGVFIISLITSAIGTKYLHQTKQFQQTATFGKVASFIPPLFVMVFSLGFSYWFVAFHHLFFNNDAWIFDAATDPIIQVLPESFFLSCFIMMIALVEIFFITIWWYFSRKAKKSI